MWSSLFRNLRHFAFLVASFRHFRKFQDIFLQFVPQLIFMLSLFGYLIFLILYKWCITLRSETAPSILLLFINMMLFDYQSEHVLLYGGQVWIHALLKAVLYSWLYSVFQIMTDAVMLYRKGFRSSWFWRQCSWFLCCSWSNPSSSTGPAWRPDTRWAEQHYPKNSKCLFQPGLV